MAESSSQDQNGKQRQFPRLLEHNYPASVAVAIIALSPFIVVSTAALMFTKHVEADVGMGRLGEELIAGFAIAGYAFGALTGGDLVLRFRQRRLFFVCEAMFAIGCAITAIAHTPVVYGFGRILSGFATGLLLVTAIPPVVRGFSAERLRITVMWINLGFFGMVCAGPLIGGIVAQYHGWRWFYAILGMVGFLNVIGAVLVLPMTDPMKPDMRFDLLAGVLGLPAVVLPFWATSELATHDFLSAAFILPLIGGLACFVALLRAEFIQKEPLSPVKRMWSTAPLVGTLVAMFAGSIFVTFVELIQRLELITLHREPWQAGALFVTLLPGVAVTAYLLGALLATRFLPILMLGGMVCLTGGGALLLLIGPGGSEGLTLAACLFLGLGAGATVSPGLYIAGLPLVSQIIGRVFALVELVRSLADYVIAPVILKIADMNSAGGTIDWPGVRLGIWITLWLSVGFTIFGSFLWIAGRGGLPKPDLEAWLHQDEPAFNSHRLLALFRGG